MNELKPCPNPWCEADEREGDFRPQVHYSNFGLVYVACTSCKMAGPTRSHEAEAIAAWNTRPTDPALAETAARLRGLMAAATDGPWKHSPWHIEEGEPAIRAPEGWIIANLSSDANAALIVEAINALPALLDAVEGKSKAAPEPAPAKD